MIGSCRKGLLAGALLLSAAVLNLFLFAPELGAQCNQGCKYLTCEEFDAWTCFKYDTCNAGGSAPNGVWTARPFDGLITGTLPINIGWNRCGNCLGDCNQLPCSAGGCVMCVAINGPQYVCYNPILSGGLQLVPVPANCP